MNFINEMIVAIFNTKFNLYQYLFVINFFYLTYENVLRREIQFGPMQKYQAKK